jgi:hypothetical protein
LYDIYYISHGTQQQQKKGVVTMKVFDMLKVSRKYFVAGLMCLTMIIGFNATAYADWNYGIGTGLFRLNAKGDHGFHTNLFGPVQFEVDLDPDDFSDLTKSAIGFAGYATDGTWMVNYTYLNLELEDTVSGATSATIGFDITGGEITLGHPVYSTPQLILGVLGGARYIKHELSAVVTQGASTVSRSTDNSWTDALVGLTLTVPLAEKWVWNNRGDAGFGGSEGTYSGSTGVTWRFYKGFSSTLYGKYTAVEYENGNEGDADWYLYDVDEFGVGLAILYNF